MVPLRYNPTQRAALLYNPTQYYDGIGWCRVVKPSEADGGIDLVGLTAELEEHLLGILFGLGFAEHLTIEPHNSVRGNEQVVGLELRLVRARLGARYI